MSRVDEQARRKNGDGRMEQPRDDREGDKARPALTYLMDNLGDFECGERGADEDDQTENTTPREGNNDSR